MNTENRVLAMLNKIGNVRTAKKENLGAIEDAINDAKKNIETSKTLLYDLISNFNNDIDDVIIRSADMSENLRTTLQEATMGYNEFRENYVAIVSEFEDLGIPFDNAIQDIDDKFEEAYALADNLVEKLAIG